MTNKFRIILKSFIIVVFSAIVIAFFRFYSLLRPAAFGALYKESIVGCIVLAFSYLNYFFLYPRFFERRRYLFYVIATVNTAFIATFLEIVLVYPQISEIVKRISELAPKEYFVILTLSIFLRNICFFFFFFMINLLESAYNEKDHINILLQKHNKLLLAKKGKELVTVHLEDIVYCQQNANYAYLYLVDGSKVYRSCSLKKLYQLLTPSRAVRISRQTIVLYKHIISYDDHSVYVDALNNGLSKGFKISDTYQQQALLLLLKENCSLLEDREIKPEPTSIELKKTMDDIKQIETEEATADVISNEESYQISPQVLSFIKEHPDCKGSEITEFCGLSLRTVNRILKQLKDEGLITFEGSKKTGGYRAVGN